MNWYEYFLQMIFPSKASYFKLNQIPKSPEIANAKNVFSFFDYQSKKGKELIYYIKKYRDQLLMKNIAHFIYENLLEEMSDYYQFNEYLNPIIISIPISKQSLRNRGFNQVSDLSQELSILLKGKYNPKILIKDKETKKQALIQERSKRHINIRNSFSVPLNKRHLIKDQDIILVDDLITTGATIQEASRILLKYKVRNIIAITIAH